jgi:restriction endonuclease Mrr
MFSRQDIYKDDLLYLIEQICDMDDFTHLLRWDDGEEKVKKAKESVNALRKSTEGYFKRKSNEKTIAQHRANYQKQILKMQNSSEKLQEMYSKFLDMFKVQDAQKRGYMFEEFLVDIFNFFDLDAKSSFRIEGEQIDGAFSFDGADYLLEAKWTKSPIEKTELSVFHEKIESKLKNTLGLFVSVNGYTETATNSGFRNNNMVLMDGQDIVQILENRISLPDLLRQKRKHAAQTGEIMFRVQC